MKNKFFLIVILLATYMNVYSQNKIGEGVIKTKSITFSGKKIGTSSMGITNQNNISIINTPPKMLKKLSEVKYSDPNAVSFVFLQVFSKQKLEQLLPEKNIVLTFYPDHTGKVRAVQFLVKNNTLITPTELELLENNLKTNVSFIIPKGENDSDNIWPLTQVVFFDKLYQKSLVN